jgi:gamma-D-glutamyl-L-lysine dipeptidyl-peptidase
MNKQIKMQFGFCELAVVPVRTEPSDRAEMSTQLLFGDIVEITEQTGSWLNIRNHFDEYAGWIDFKQVRIITDDEYRRLKEARHFVNRDLMADSVMYSGQAVRLPAGCSFYDLKGRVMLVGEQQYVLLGAAFQAHYDGTDKLIETAMGFMSCPYLWGGKTYLGLDCSGLTQVVYKQHGINLLRDAIQQSAQGELISFLSDSKPGDLAFFDNSEGMIVHVGILLANQKILHCSGKVRVDNIDHQGIFNKELNRYTHSLRLIRRVTGI